jgi:chemotaxis protein methyltransferase CheR
MHNLKSQAPLTIDQLVQSVASIIEKESANVLGERQFSMVKSRLSKRMTDLGAETPEKYWNFLNMNYSDEVKQLVSLLTTHHTFFFREFLHFDYLLTQLPELVKKAKQDKRNKLSIWCAACSRGQEVYSLAIFLNTHLREIDPSMTFEILGSDIDHKSVEVAKNAVYHKAEINEVPMHYLKDNFIRGKGQVEDFVKIRKDIKDKCQFDVLNLTNYQSRLGVRKFDFILCRNVFIYFEEEQVRSVVKNFTKNLYNHGFLITGVSESLQKIDSIVKSIGPSVWKDSTTIESSENEKVDNVVSIAPIVHQVPQTIRVLCVDDSASILKLLSKLLTKDKGFEIVATAKNGIEAAEMMKKHQVDAMTLDIHMPEMGGVSYLEKHFNSNHPPVIMISSASREDSKVSLKALDLGASDFVEKPALNNLSEKGEEIRNKIKVAISFKNQRTKSNLSSLDQEFKKDFTVSNPENKAFVVHAGMNDRDHLKKMVEKVGNRSNQPPMIFFLESQPGLLDQLTMSLAEFSKDRVHLLEGDFKKLQSGHFYIADFKTYYDQFFTHYAPVNVSSMMFGRMSDHVLEKIKQYAKPHFLVEDLSINEDLKNFASDFLPWTSFIYLATQYLSEVK